VIIKIATKVKNEDDIIDKRIEHHGEIYGYENIHVIENYSTDNTYEICKSYLYKGIHLTREKDFRRKGDYMTHCLNNVDCDVFIPVDIDEFLGYYNKKENTITKSRDTILSYLESINTSSNNAIFKMAYVEPKNTTDENGLGKFTHGAYNHYLGNAAKTFVIKKHLVKNFRFDQGFHYKTDKYILSDLILIHFHNRSHEQVIKKVHAQVTGIGHIYELEYLEKVVNTGRGALCRHRIRQAIDLLKNPEAKRGPPLVTSIPNNYINIENITIN
jgi:hypothetical protein